MTLQTPLSRKRFLQGSAAVGGGMAIGGPLAALAARGAEGHEGPHAPGYGPIAPTPAQGSGTVHLALPAGFKYRVISKQLDPSTAYVTDPATGLATKTTVGTPGIFDGMGAFRGPRGTTILIRNHEHRQQVGEPAVMTPIGDRYDPNPRYNAGNTKVVVDRDRNVLETIHVLAGTSTNCAGGEMPWGSWITCEEVFIAPSATDLKHGYCFEIDAYADEPNPAVPIKAAGCFPHEAVAWLKGILYETEDNGKPSGFYRWVPDRRPREFGDLATTGGPLQAIKRKGTTTSFDADSAAVGDEFEVEWVTIPNPDPPTNSVRTQGAALGMIAFSRLEGCWVGDGKIYFDSTSGGPARAGQVWEYDPREEKLRLVYQSTSTAVLQSPDNLVYVPHTGDVWLQEDGAGEQFVRGVTQDGEIYDFAKTILNDSEFCGGVFAPDGRTFFLNQQGGTGVTNPADVDAAGALTYAIWGPFGRGRGHDDD
ncbi:MAG TPA: alkaline phosphatase PhoX [Solirubrobacteraceae bacterium]|nr:alkaline phosphatase PhoX [Solirubrobacteraceae bacterium]